MGLISRVSSRTYRSDFKKTLKYVPFRTCRKKGFKPQFKQTRSCWSSSHKSSWWCPNGVIRYNPHKLTYSSFQISGNMMLIWFVVGSFISYEVLTFDEIHWPKLYQTASWHAWYTHWKRYGITPDLNDHSYGAWNYYPMTRKGIVYR